MHPIEIWVRALIGLGNIYDGAVVFGGDRLIHGDWLALKILLFGVTLLASAWVRAKMRPVRKALAQVNPLPPQRSILDERQSTEMLGHLSKVRPGIHLILLIFLIAAWMGLDKSFWAEGLARPRISFSESLFDF